MSKEQYELEYQELIAQVAEIDKDAAAYMIYEMRKLEEFNACGDLWNVVYWGDTPQGHSYWHDIACKLEE